MTNNKVIKPTTDIRQNVYNSFIDTMKKRQVSEDVLNRFIKMFEQEEKPSIDTIKKALFGENGTEL